MSCKFLLFFIPEVMASVRPKQYNKRLCLASEKLTRSAEENETQHNQNSTEIIHWNMQTIAA